MITRLTLELLVRIVRFMQTDLISDKRVKKLNNGAVYQRLLIYVEVCIGHPNESACVNWIYSLYRPCITNKGITGVSVWLRDKINHNWYDCRRISNFEKQWWWIASNNFTSSLRMALLQVRHSCNFTHFYDGYCCVLPMFFRYPVETEFKLTCKLFRVSYELLCLSEILTLHRWYRTWPRGRGWLIWYQHVTQPATHSRDHPETESQPKADYIRIFSCFL